jgi:dolichol-phosphate mannosyltransferase
MQSGSGNLRRVYQARFSAGAKEAKAQVWKVLVECYFQRWVEPSYTVLDLGCGFGEFLNHVRCERRIGVDLNPDSRKYLQPEIVLHLGNACHLDFLPDQSIDFVFCSNLMEHLADKGEVEWMLGEIWRVLRYGGYLVAMGPNIRFLNGRYWDFWDHLVPITDRSLAEILESLGFHIVLRISRFLPFTTCSLLPKSPWLLKGYLRLPMLWPLLGRQFLIRAHKPRE